MASNGPVVLVILDGWGIAPDSPGNAISAAKTPNMDSFLRAYPHTRLRCSGEDVGLPDGQMGNSEVGHTNIGAGFVVYQSITRIDRSIRDGSFNEIKAFEAARDHARANDARVHLIGLIGDGGVHAHHRHWKGLLEFFATSSFNDVIVHAVMDGRDTEPTSGIGYMRTLIAEMNRTGVGRIGSISGRYYAMDRDHRWERTEQAWNAIVHGIGKQATEPERAIQDSYAQSVTDEFIEPIVINGANSEIRNGDAVIFVNFRADRMRQLVSALTLDDNERFSRGTRPGNLYIATMTEYDDDFPVAVAFPPQNVEQPLARIVSEAGMTQFHLAETEKYAHVTYFINGGREEPFPGEDRQMVPSPNVPTYDLQPEMSAPEVTSVALEAINSRRYQLIVINYANGDMVGHTGDFDAAKAAIEAVDHGLGQLVEATLQANGIVIATADHGNAEEMLIPGTTDVWTAHSMNPVPLVMITPDDHPERYATLRAEGRLADIAPTVLALLGIEPPAAMEGQSLIS